MPHFLPLLLLCAAAHAAEVAQFRANDFGEEWRAARGGAALVAVHPVTNGWTTAFADRGGVSFSATNGVPSPLEFDPATTSAVARALIVADCTEARPWSALLDAPVGAALAPRAFDWDVIRFATSNCLGTVAVSVDGVAGAAMPTNGTIAAGTADFVSPESVLDGSAARHRNADVHPYLYALHLDGNPGLPDNLTGWFTESVPSRLSRPCIHQGEHLRSYIDLRPTLPTGIAPP